MTITAAAAPAAVAAPAATRRQARFCAAKVIICDGLQPEVWYEICQGRRRDDNRPGMVLLDLGDRRLLVAEALLEIREVPADAPRARLPRPRRVPGIRGARWGLATLRRRLPRTPESRALVALTASVLVPLGMAAGFALGRVGEQVLGARG
ncbi:MAG TPA: hypothetical protein VFS40_07275 [Gemmatimonadales bacterium]|nr:hypothetical protein [Gemmatimonadales bacterium]